MRVRNYDEFTYEYGKHSVYDIVMENYKLLLVSQLPCSNQACCLLLFSMWSYVLSAMTVYWISHYSPGSQCEVRVVYFICRTLFFIGRLPFITSESVCFRYFWLVIFFQMEHRINTVIDVFKLTSPRVINESTLTIHFTTVGGPCWKHIDCISHCMAGMMNG